ncbi:nucleotidyltransferase substrate binding protein, partial [Salmonella enterica]|nr:nucleotidyltransferase substrate binding protein [Salmonella enterica]
GLAAARAAPGDELMRDGVIQRFEYTYELSHKSLRRSLEETEPAPEAIRELSFPGLIRLGAERGLLRNSWDVWTDHRKARGTTSHTYDSAKAAEVFARIPAFLEDARALLAALEARVTTS